MSNLIYYIRSAGALAAERQLLETTVRCLDPSRHGYEASSLAGGTLLALALG